MLHIAVCDDNKLLCSALENDIKKILPKYSSLPFSIKQFTSSKNFMEAINNQEFQLAFVDIDFGDNDDNGIVLGQKINEVLPSCQIIFVTAHLQYVSAVYEVQHTYFVLKNEINRYLPHALNKALINLDELKKQVLCIQNNKETVRISQNDIVYLERDGRITKINTVDATYTTYEKLDEIEKKLPMPPFIRCHRSFIANFTHVHNLRKTEFLCDNDVIVPISRSYYPSVKMTFVQFIDNIL